MGRFVLCRSPAISSAPSFDTEVSQAFVSRRDEQARRLKGSRPLPDLQYQNDPIGWARDILGLDEKQYRWSLYPEYANHSWDGTVDPLAVMVEGLAAGKDVGVESGTGTGKTYTAGWICPWFLVCWPEAIIVTTATKEDQLTLHLWKEMATFFPQLRKHYPTLMRAHLRLRAKPLDVLPDNEDDWSKEKWAVIGYACGVDAETSSMGQQGAAAGAKGFHAPNMLIVTEETQGIRPPIMTALGNTCTGDHNLRLALGNPSYQGDALHLFCLSPDVVHVRISALDHPNVVCGRDVIPGAVGQKSVTKRLKEYGVDSPLYDAQVRGISPAQSAWSLILREWCTTASAKWSDPEYRQGPRALGVDVAQSENGDKAAIASFQGQCLDTVESFRCTDATALGYTVIARMSRETHPIKAEHVGIDSVGIGAATVNACKHKRYNVRALNGGANPIERAQRGPDGGTHQWAPDANSFANLRAQMYWQLREDLRLGVIALPNDRELFDQLTMIRFTDEKSSGKTIIESKDVIRKRTGGQSPDMADAVAYANWVRPRREAVRVTPFLDRDRHPGLTTAGRRRRPVTDGLARILAENTDESAWHVPEVKVPVGAE